jgi:hypothetical protein
MSMSLAVRVRHRNRTAPEPLDPDEGKVIYDSQVRDRQRQLRRGGGCKGAGAEPHVTPSLHNRGTNVGDFRLIDLPLTTRFDDRWPQGIVGKRATRVLKNARVYLAEGDASIVKIGWGDLCLEQWGLLRTICGDGLLLVAFEPNPSERSEAPDATLADLLPRLALALDSSAAVLLNHPDPEFHTLGALSLPAFDREQTPDWVAARFAELTERA